MSDSPIPEEPATEDPIAQGRALRWTTTAIYTAALFLLIFNATSLANWSAALKPTDFSVKVASLAAAWKADTARFGLTTPGDIVHDAWANARAATFGNNAGAAGADGPPPG